jgi:hypothetical protein
VSRIPVMGAGCDISDGDSVSEWVAGRNSMCVPRPESLETKGIWFIAIT